MSIVQVVMPHPLSSPFLAKCLDKITLLVKMCQVTHLLMARTRIVPIVNKFSSFSPSGLSRSDSTYCVYQRLFQCGCRTINIQLHNDLKLSQVNAIIQWAPPIMAHSGTVNMVTVPGLPPYPVSISRLMQRYKQTSMTLPKRSEMSWGKKRERRRRKRKLCPRIERQGFWRRQRSLCPDHSSV